MQPMRYILFLIIVQLFSIGELIAQSYSGTIQYGEFPYFQILSPEYLVSITDWLTKIEGN